MMGRRLPLALPPPEGYREVTGHVSPAPPLLSSTKPRSDAEKAEFPDAAPVVVSSPPPATFCHRRTRTGAGAAIAISWMTAAASGVRVTLNIEESGSSTGVRVRCGTLSYVEGAASKAKQSSSRQLCTHGG